ncbi:hypothetical protein IW140_001893 [Coemansia sp. RSA 1813]|nr:hypothetical protein LPJ74_003645 [Coemansia sp. RSA 1843]KAJ2087262.1 hypothetical protein IW138_005108 [Coemansia sp. RSA 986]KAJ2570939.1 hypothetical protein IW140_001893 [Coemansia sp. RSA 1813]
MPTILSNNNIQSVENVHSCHATAGYHSLPSMDEGADGGVFWPQEIKVSGRRRPVGEFQWLQERAAIAGPLFSANDNHAMRKAGLVNSSIVYHGNDSSNDSMHSVQADYQGQAHQQQPEPDLWSSLLSDKQNVQGIQSLTNSQEYMQIPSYMHEERDAAVIAAAAALLPDNDCNLILSTLNSLIFPGSPTQAFPVSASSCVQETIQFAPNSTISNSTINSSISSPIARCQTVEYAAVPTGSTAQAPLALHDKNTSVVEEKHEIWIRETADAFSNERHSKLAVKKKRASCKHRSIGKRNREPDKASPTFTPHAQAELRKTLRDIHSNPFPDVSMVADLCKRLGLSNRQVRNWFAVHRFRDMSNIDVDGVKMWRFRDNLF